MQHLLLRFAVLAVLLASPAAIAAPSRKPQPAKPAAADPRRAELDRLAQEHDAAYARRAYPAMATLARKGLALQTAVSGPDDEATQIWRRRLADALYLSGDYKGAVAVRQLLLATAEKRHGAESRDALVAIEAVMTAYSPDQYTERLAAMQRVLALTRKLYGDKSLEYADKLGNYAGLLFGHREYVAQLPLREQRLQILEALPRSPYVDDLILSELIDLGRGYWITKQPARAIAAFERARGIVARPGTALDRRTSTLWALVAYDQEAGRDDLAAPLVAEATALYEAEIARLTRDKPDDRRIASMLDLVAYYVRRSGDIAGAERLYDRAYALHKKLGDPAATAMALADIKRMQGKPQQALALYREAQTEAQRTAPQAAWTYDAMIADVLRDLGDTPGAERTLIGYRAYVEKTYGRRSYIYATAETQLANLWMQTGKAGPAEPLLVDAFDIEERELDAALQVGTEIDHATAIRGHSHSLDFALQFHRVHARTSAGAARLALTEVLRLKGRALDAVAADLASVRAQLSPADKQLLDDLAAARAQLAKLTVAGPTAGDAELARQIAALEDQIHKLEVLIAGKSSAYRAARTPVTLAAVQRAIPRTAKLVEIINFQPYVPNAPYAQRTALPPRAYAAYVAGTTGDPVLVELGPAAAIDTAAEAFRKALSDPGDDRAAQLGHALYSLTLAKLTSALGATGDVLIAPDGALNLVPFAALVDDRGEFLVKRTTFTYLTSGRDLLRLAIKTKPRSGGIIFADPTFDSAARPAPPQNQPSRGRRATEMVGQSWKSLPGTGQEASAIASRIPGVTVYRGASATESQLKEVHGPKILHLATHGFFLKDEPDPAAGRGSDNPIQTAEAAENPLLRSGLVLAGANQLSSGNDDGVLTALEAAGLDLWGTQLVALSACETGIGKITNGDGVYGLRRAFVIAGAESLLMSLWQVDDDATRDLMTGYYARLSAGKPRSSALREIQLEILGTPKYAHPYYWASFLSAGDNTPIQ